MAGENEGQATKRRASNAKGKVPPRSPAILADDNVEEAKDRRGHARDSAKKRHWLRHGIKPAEWIMIIFTAVTAAAGWGSVIVADGQWKIMRKQLAGADESSRQAERAIDATTQLAATAGYQGAIADQAWRTAKAQQDRLIAANERLSVAAQTQVVTARDAMINDDRAWVGIGPTTIQKLPDGRYLVTVMFLNTGRTPALGLVQNFAASTLDTTRNIPKIAKAACASIIPLPTANVLYPTTSGQGQSFSMTVSDPQGAPFLIQGCVRYRTMGHVHTSEFCEYSDVSDPGKASPKPIEQAVFRYCPLGNRAD